MFNRNINVNDNQEIEQQNVALRRMIMECASEISKFQIKVESSNITHINQIKDKKLVYVPFAKLKYLIDVIRKKNLDINALKIEMTHFNILLEKVADIKYVMELERKIQDTHKRINETKKNVGLLNNIDKKEYYMQNYSVSQDPEKLMSIKLFEKESQLSIYEKKSSDLKDKIMESANFIKEQKKNIRKMQDENEKLVVLVGNYSIVSQEDDAKNSILNKGRLERYKVLKKNMVELEKQIEQSMRFNDEEFAKRKKDLKEDLVINKRLTEELNILKHRPFHQFREMQNLTENSQFHSSKTHIKDAIMKIINPMKEKMQQNQNIFRPRAPSKLKDSPVPFRSEQKHEYQNQSLIKSPLPNNIISSPIPIRLDQKDEYKYPSLTRSPEQTIFKVASISPDNMKDEPHNNIAKAEVLNQNVAKTKEKMKGIDDLSFENLQKSNNITLNDESSQAFIKNTLENVKTIDKNQSHSIPQSNNSFGYNKASISQKTSIQINKEVKEASALKSIKNNDIQKIDINIKQHYENNNGFQLSKSKNLIKADIINKKLKFDDEIEKPIESTLQQEIRPQTLMNNSNSLSHDKNKINSIAENQKNIDGFSNTRTSKTNITHEDNTDSRYKPGVNVSKPNFSIVHRAKKVNNPDNNISNDQPNKIDQLDNHESPVYLNKKEDTKDKSVLHLIETNVNEKPIAEQAQKLDIESISREENSIINKEKDKEESNNIPKLKLILELPKPNLIINKISKDELQLKPKKEDILIENNDKIIKIADNQNNKLNFLEEDSKKELSLNNDKNKDYSNEELPKPKFIVQRLRPNISPLKQEKSNIQLDISENRSKIFTTKPDPLVSEFTTVPKKPDKIADGNKTAFWLQTDDDSRPIKTLNEVEPTTKRLNLIKNLEHPQHNSFDENQEKQSLTLLNKNKVPIDNPMKIDLDQQRHKERDTKLKVIIHLI